MSGKKRVLVICQLYWPDEANLAAHLTDLTRHLNKEGHSITVFSSNHAYENTKDKYKIKEDFEGIQIHRIRDFGFGKGHKIGRILDILSFNINLFFRLLFLKSKNFDLILGLTNPPLISFFGVVVARIKKIPFHYWAMDLQPELAFKIGYLNPDAMTSKIFSYMSHYIMRHSTQVIALDRFMKSYIERESKNPNVNVVPVWPTAPDELLPEKLNNSFRKKHGLQNKFVVMYSGNHCATHPLDTLLQSSLLLKDDSSIEFVFIGEGVRKRDVIEFKSKHNLENILILPYQPRSYLHISLSAADLQVVVMGNDLTGLTHPSKIYSNMQLGCPILYIGPVPSHASEILESCTGNLIFNHGEDEKVTEGILNLSKLSSAVIAEINTSNKSLISNKFASSVLMQKLSDYLVS